MVLSLASGLKIGMRTRFPQAQQFGNWVDKAGKTKPFIFLVHDQDNWVKRLA